MAKILKNTTNAPLLINDTGISLSASPSIYTIPTQDYLLWASSNDIITEIGNGNVIVNDGSNDLESATATALIQGNFRATKFDESLLTNDGHLKVAITYDNSLLDGKLKISTNDSSSGYLYHKLDVPANKLTLTIQDPGLNETLLISPGTDLFDKTSDTTTSVTEGSNLYFTEDRTKTAISNAIGTQDGITVSYDGDFNFTNTDKGSSAVTSHVAALDPHANATGSNSGFMPAADKSKLDQVTSVELGYLTGVSSAIQTQLNNKQAIGNYITNLTGDVTASGPGSVAATLANTAVTPGSYGSVNNFPTFTVDSKGRLTAAGTQNFTPSQWVDAGGVLSWSDESGKDLAIYQANSSGESPVIRQIRSRGTIASPSAVLSGDKLGGHGFYGWNSGGQNTNPSVDMSVYATENHTPSAQGSELRFTVTPNLSSSPVSAMILRQNGELDAVSHKIINVATPTNSGDVANKAYVDAATSGSIFGTQFSYAESLALSTLASSSLSTKVTLNTGTVPAGTYRVGWNFEWYCTDNANDFRGRIIVDGATILCDSQEEHSEAGTDQRNLRGGFGYITFGSSNTHTVLLQYARSAGAGTVGIQRARLEFWRVS